MATLFTYIVVGWVCFGLGTAFSAYLLMSSRMMDDMRIERNITSPQKMLADWVRS